MIRVHVYDFELVLKNIHNRNQSNVKYHLMTFLSVLPNVCSTNTSNFLRSASNIYFYLGNISYICFLVHLSNEQIDNLFLMFLKILF